MYRQIVSGSCNSGTSSETSETQSIEDNTGCSGDSIPVRDIFHNNRNIRSIKNLEPIKNFITEMDVAEAKRPPWRAVSISTLPKPDKSAILRAKLLDASRRLRAGKLAVATQTDPAPTKLMREVSLGVQADLKDHKDVGILTDGSYALIKRGSDDYILTFSVSQMTDSKTLKSASTQTLLPKVSGDAFIEAYRAYYNNDSSIDKSVCDITDLNTIEQSLLKQIRAIRETKRPNATQTCSKEKVNASDTKVTLKNTEEILNYTKSLFPITTSSSWHFDFDLTEETGKVAPFQPYNILRARRPFSRINGGDRNFPNAHQYRSINMKAFVMNAIDELILEANNLVDCIEDLAVRNEIRARKARVGDAEKVKNAQKSITAIFPSDYWVPIIEKQEKDLCDTIRNLKTLKEMRKLEKFDWTESE